MNTFARHFILRSKITLILVPLNRSLGEVGEHLLHSKYNMKLVKYNCNSQADTTFNKT